MQEYVENQTIAISLKASKLTAKILAKAFMAVLRKIQKDHTAKAKQPQGRQSVKRLTGRYDAKAIPINGATRLFDQVIKEKNLKVDYSFMKTGPEKYLLLFKAEQVDTIMAAFAEYTNRVMARARDKRPPIREQLNNFGEQARSTPPREQERKREVIRDER